MPITNISYQIVSDAKQRRIVYTGEYGKGLALTYGPVITTDNTYDPLKEQATVQAYLNARLKQQEIESWLRDPSQPPPLVEATKDEYYAMVLEREQAAKDQLADEQAKVAEITTAKDQVKPTLVEKVVAFFKGL